MSVLKSGKSPGNELDVINAHLPKYVDLTYTAASWNDGGSAYGSKSSGATTLPKGAVLIGFKITVSTLPASSTGSTQVTLKLGTLLANDATYMAAKTINLSGYSPAGVAGDIYYAKAAATAVVDTALDPLILTLTDVDGSPVDFGSGLTTPGAYTVRVYYHDLATIADA